jgi:hypothetical protein
VQRFFIIFYFFELFMIFSKNDDSIRLCRRVYAEGKAVGIAYAEGRSYADGQTGLRRGASTPRDDIDETFLGIDYVDDHCALRQGLSAVGVTIHSCSVI